MERPLHSTALGASGVVVIPTQNLCLTTEVSSTVVDNLTLGEQFRVQCSPSGINFNFKLQYWSRDV